MTHLPQKKIYLILLFAIIAFAYSFPIFKQGNNWGVQDWDQHLFFHAVPRVTLLEYQQMPLWNPYYVGGTVMLANPQSRLLSPTFLLVLLFGEVIGLKIEIWLHLVIGLLGTYLLARHYALAPMAALMASFVFMLNSMYALSLTVGMTWFLSIAYLPWAFLFYLKALDDLKYALVSALFLTLIFFSGGVYPLPIALLFFGVYAVILGIFKEYSFLRLARLLAMILIFTICLGAIKFFPTIEFQRIHPRWIYDYSGYSLNALGFSLFNRDQSLDAIANLPIEQRGFINGVTGGMDENGMYIGFLPFALFIVGLGWRDKRRMFLFLAFLIFLWISFGNRPRAELWSLLHLLPVFDSMRIAQRFRIVFMLCLAIFAGFGFQALRNYIFRMIPNQYLAQFSTTAILGIVLSDLLIVSSPIFKDAFPIPPLEIPRRQQFHQVWEFPSYDKNGWLISNADNIIYSSDHTTGLASQLLVPGYDNKPANLVEAYTSPLLLRASYGSLYPTFMANIGTINGYESANVPRNAVSISAETYRGEVYLKDTTGAAIISKWSPNRLVVKVEPSSPGFLVLNQNYYNGWHVAGLDGREVEAVDQRLAVRIFPDDQQIELYYRPKSFVIGALVTAATVLLGLVFAIWQLRSFLPKHFFGGRSFLSKTQG